MLYFGKGYRPNMDANNFLTMLSVFLWSYPAAAVKRQVCQQLGPLSCQNGGVLYFQSVYCRSYGYAMQLLQENCSGLSKCRTDVVQKFLTPRCCGQQPGNPYIIYQCTSGTGEVFPETSRLDRGVSGEEESSQSGGHSLQDEIVILAVVIGVVFLWGVGLIFFYLRYKSNHCSWLKSRNRTKHAQSGLANHNPVYHPPVLDDSGHYVEIEAISSTPVYTNVVIPSAPPPLLLRPLQA